MGTCLGIAGRGPMPDANEAHEENNSHEPEDDFHSTAPSVQPPQRFYERKRRFSVSAECAVPSSQPQVKKIFPKSDEARERIAKAIQTNILFNNLDDEQRKDVFDAMFEVTNQPGDVVIKQGDDGDNFYVVDTGTYDIYVAKGGGEPQLVVSISNNGSFGELALMYNCPRAATVKARTEGKLWAMDRQTFRRILMDTTNRKRKQYEKFLENVPILASMDFYERCTVADAVEPQSFKAGETVIRQGETGDAFYIIEEGEAKALQSPGPDVPPIEVLRLKRGDYFGEIALLTEQPRKATIEAVTDLKCITLDRKSFTRLLGPIDDILKRNMSNYKTYEQIIKNAS